MTDNAKDTEPEEYLWPEVAAERLGVSTQSLRRYAARGLITFRTLPSGHKRYAAADIEKLRRPTGSPDVPP